MNKPLVSFFIGVAVGTFILTMASLYFSAQFDDGATDMKKLVPVSDQQSGEPKKSIPPEAIKALIPYGAKFPEVPENERQKPIPEHVDAFLKKLSGSVPPKKDD